MSERGYADRAARIHWGDVAKVRSPAWFVFGYPGQVQVTVVLDRAQQEVFVQIITM